MFLTFWKSSMFQEMKKNEKVALIVCVVLLFLLGVTCLYHFILTET